MHRLILPAAALVLATGCNDYEIFRTAGFAQESFSNDADILFVVDNSASMTEEAVGLAEGMDSFLQRLTNPEEGGLQTNGLADAVENYIQFAANREAYVDYQIAVTTTNVAGEYGALSGVGLVDNAEDDVRGLVLDALLCEAACLVGSEIPSDPSYQAGSIPDNVSQEFLDDFCGTDWEADCPSHDEEPVEAVFMAMCRAVPEDQVPAECYEQNQFTAADIESNAGLIRPGSTVIPVILTDEGDYSRRQESGSPDISEYKRVFGRFDNRLTWAVIGPDNSTPCADLSVQWAEDRLRTLVEDSRGRYFPISVSTGGGCEVTDFDQALDELGQLLNSLLDRFPLAVVPDEESIIVFVEGKFVDEAIENADGTYTDGWRYDADENSIAFEGTAVPDYEEEVRIYYLPLTGMPRDLPF